MMASQIVTCTTNCDQLWPKLEHSIWIYSVCPLQTTPNRIKCSSFEIPMLSHIHIMCNSICNGTQHHMAWYLISTWYGNVIPEGMGMSYLCGVKMWYQMEWECHTYVVWKCDTRWNGNPLGSYYGDETIPYHVESYHTRPYHGDRTIPYHVESYHTRPCHGSGIMESYHTMGMESLQDCS